MTSWLQAAAYMQHGFQTIYQWYTFVRQRLALPLLQRGGRDMYLLRSGQWIDATIHINDTVEILGIYRLASHSVRPPQSSDTIRLPRWSWLSVKISDASGNALDTEPENTVLTDFLGTLRTSISLTPGQALTLFAFQKGWLPTGWLTVFGSDGTEETLTCADLYVPGR